MSNICYTLTEPSMFPASEQLLYISSSMYEKDWKSMFHSHSFAEIFYITDGIGTLQVDEQKYSLKTDDILIINPHIKHTETSSADHKLSYIVLGIDNMKFDFTTQNGFCIYNNVSKHYPFLPLLNLMLEEIKQQDEFGENILRSYLSILLRKIKKMTDCTLTFHSNTNVPTECETIKSYIDSHYQDMLTLDDLAKLAHWDKFYFSHMFAKTYGIAPINYLLERRIMHSKELLKSTDLSVSQVAQSTGFSSQNYFSQAFKKNTGETPLQYRKRHIR